MTSMQIAGLTKELSASGLQLGEMDDPGLSALMDLKCARRAHPRKWRSPHGLRHSCSSTTTYGPRSSARQLHGASIHWTRSRA